jgi:hypothetical protein
MPKISQLATLVDVASDDFLEIVDFSTNSMSSSGTNSKITAGNLANGLAKIITSGAVITNNTANDPALRIIQTGATNTLVVQDENSDTSPLVITGDGRVIIGSTTSASYYLPGWDTNYAPGIQGIGSTFTGASWLALSQWSTSKTDSGGAFISLNKSNGVYGTHTAVEADQRLGGIGFAGSDGTLFQGVADIYGEVDGAPGVDVPGRLVFATSPSTNDATPFERMRITSGGSVGIGTTAPGARLEVSNTGDTQLRITSSNAQTPNLYLRRAGGASYRIGIINTDPDFAIQQYDSAGALLSTPLMINNGGEVIQSQYSTNTTGNSLQFKKYRGTVAAPTAVVAGDTIGAIDGVGYDGWKEFTASQIAFAVDGAPTQLASSMTGNMVYRIVTLGDTTTAQWQAAGVVGTPTVGMTFTFNSAVNTVPTSGTGTVVRDDGDMPGRIVFSTTADGAGTLAERVRITSAGRVGIGNTTPSAALHVSQNSGTIPAVQITQTGAAAALVVQDEASDASPFIITADGNVGIKTAAPGAALEVTGDLKLTGTSFANSASAGTSGAVPAQVAGYLIVNINGVSRKIPYYAT